MAVDFPNSPTNGDTFTSGTLTWTYSSAKNGWNVLSSGIVGPSPSWGDWTPTISAITSLGSSGSGTYRYVSVGKLITCWGRIVFGTGASGSGSFKITTPSTPNANMVNTPTGRFRINIFSGTPYVGTVVINAGSATGDFLIETASGTYSDVGTAMSNGTPVTWGNLSSINFSFWYEEA